MKEISVLGTSLQLLPEKAIYIEALNSLLVSDVHLGKSETFQSLGVPIPNTINQVTLNRLQQLCTQVQPKSLFILGDLFHSKFALVDEVLDSWFHFIKTVDVDVQLIVGNHDRALVPALKTLSINCFTDAIQVDKLILSHEPYPQPKCLNICGHVHPYIRIKTRLDNLRLPCFYLKRSDKVLILPPFGEFTGGYEVALDANSAAYVVVENSVISFEK